MHVIFVVFKLKPEYKQLFLDASLEDASQSLANEPGCVRFDVSIDVSDTNKLYFYEIYLDANAFESHKTTSHFLNWRSIVQDDWFAEPFEIMQSSLFFPKN